MVLVVLDDRIDDAVDHVEAARLRQFYRVRETPGDLAP
jgi:hypothetical protein